MVEEWADAGNLWRLMGCLGAGRKLTEQQVMGCLGAGRKLTKQQVQKLGEVTDL